MTPASGGRGSSGAVPGGREGTAGSRAERPRSPRTVSQWPPQPGIAVSGSRCEHPSVVPVSPHHSIPVSPPQCPHLSILVSPSLCPHSSVPTPVSRCPHIPALHTPLSPVPASALLPLSAQQRCSRRWEQCGAASCWHGSMRCLHSVSPQEAPIRGAGHPPSRTKPLCPTSPGESVKFQQLHQQPKPLLRPRGCFGRQGSEAWVRAPHNLPDPRASSHLQWLGPSAPGALAAPVQEQRARGVSAARSCPSPAP